MSYDDIPHAAKTLILAGKEYKEFLYLSPEDLSFHEPDMVHGWGPTSLYRSECDWYRVTVAGPCRTCF
jgi:hypothetical protein